ncbi:HCP-like protein [Linnemannia elongata AG-77]|uniref:HCP-like protein n=1 Tax=Linnemannia elongata AG-77 TaxID=1314771 RepID=A0A197JTC1_9FUNG|nr:HCP-like protein [Linnemannia elongata AG-77]
MQDALPQLQALRAVNKNSRALTPADPDDIIYVDCHQDPDTKRDFVLWEDILVAFHHAVHVRHHARVVPFLKGADYRTLEPRRIAAITDKVLDVIVDTPLTDVQAASIPGPSNSITLLTTDPTPTTPLEKVLPDRPQEPAAECVVIHPAAPRRNPVYGLEETAMDNYSHINHPDFLPKPRAPQYVPTADQDGGSNKSAHIAPRNDNEPTNDNAQANIDKPTSISQSHQSSQDPTATTPARDISPIVVKASLGDAKSQVELGDIYRAGDGVEQDFEAARYWYLKAANQGDPAGQCNLGHLYRLELGVERNHSTALSWYKKAAYQGDAGGQCFVGLVHECGLVGAMDYSAAMDWYMMAASQGYAYAQYSVGELYIMGHGVERDYDKAMEWHLQAAAQGLPAAQAAIGRMYLHGTGVKRNEAIALEWFDKAVSRKDVDVWSQMTMGLMYLRGLGVSKSDSTALAWFLKAARRGSPTAQSVVGRMYRDGVGTSQDYSEALVWFLKAANHNGSYVQHEIGAMYLQGQGVPKNYLIAKEWFIKAAKFGCEEARASVSEVQQLIDKDTK